MRSTSLICVLLVLILTSCSSLPKPSADELKARDQWGALIAPQTRQRVIDEANHHTNWTEKRRVQFEIERFQHIYRDQQRKSRATQPSTRSANRT
jgi:hypothetical protein